ncbi:MAG: helix-turn-helix domain-containing protein [Lentisphaeria bacterium]|nr:helix-turn-helix domain-containing protein [Lentisphaeria bacterium]
MMSPTNELICDFSILRDLRKRANMSIARLSGLCGVSASVISKLERNQTTAEMETLFRIARVFGLTLSDLISLAENRRAHCVSSVRYLSGDFHFDRVAYSNLRCMHAVAPAGATVSSPELHRDDYELCWVLKGKLLFTLPEESHELCAGQSIQFDALLPHTYKALEDCEIVIVHLRKEKRF